MVDLVERLIERRKIIFQENEKININSVEKLNEFSDFYKYSKNFNSQKQDSQLMKFLPNNNGDESADFDIDCMLKQISNKIIERHQPEIEESPQYHPNWKLMRVITGHTGWVRSLDVEPGNEWFASGSSDSTIKIWDLASGKLKLTLTGHIMGVRGIKISNRHPYMFSCSEDKTIKCWDLEKNAVVRDYYGHLSAVYSIDLHPNLDILVTGGRDSSVRLWDMRSRVPIHVMTGHTSNVYNVKTRPVDPQVISTSADGTIRLWDIVAGKTRKILTNHSKSVSALAISPFENSFVTGSPGQIKKWGFFNDGGFIEDFNPSHDSIINTLSINQDGVLFSGGDDGSMKFYDYKTAKQFQELQTIKMPGSNDSEAGIYTSTFDQTGLRLITGEVDKSIKVWKEE